MKTKILKTEQDYNAACELIYKLMHSTENSIEPDSPEGEEIEILSLLVEKYEQEHHRMDAPDPIAAIKFRMEQMDLKQQDVAPLFGGKTRVSEILNGKRTLTLKMITLLNRYLGIPLESLISGNKEIKLQDEQKEKLLKISSIQDYLKGSRAAMISRL
ncbi:MAG: helix-turn-helix domain-containing protein [Bacteroidales bacterium]|nr:helix-turn-helix domain-containing protein [Bacteroidales bacterium]MDT8431777.1 helix-turn-helix domain-containing protein [Bacteroidales bacterium]